MNELGFFGKCVCVCVCGCLDLGFGVLVLVLTVLGSLFPDKISHSDKSDFREGFRVFSHYLFAFGFPSTIILINTF